MRHGGLGLVRAADTWTAAFAGAIELVVPRLADSTAADGTLCEGLADHLAVVVGTEANFLDRDRVGVDAQ